MIHEMLQLLHIGVLHHIDLAVNHFDQVLTFHLVFKINNDFS